MLGAMSTLPTGQQHTIQYGPYTATVTEVGATLRSLTFHGRELLWTFAEDEEPYKYQGAQLAPWPSRIRDGRYTFDGESHVLPINEPERNVALHGLIDQLPFECVEHVEDSLTQRVLVSPQEGWPFHLQLVIAHQLSDTGLTVHVAVANLGETPAPYGYGVHPYFDFDLDELTLEIPFTQELITDPDRLLPIELGPVQPEHDFSTARPLGEVVFDTSFTSPKMPEWQAVLSDPQGTVEVWGDATTPWLQVYTEPSRASIAIEPMTCGPDAFNPGPTHGDRIVIEPGDATECRWGVRAR